MENMLIGLGLPVVTVIVLLWLAVKKLNRSPDIRLMARNNRRSTPYNR